MRSPQMRAAQEAREKPLRRNRWFAGAAALLAFALLANSAWQSRKTERREAILMTSAADKAIKEGLYDRAMRIAVQGLPPAGALPLFSLGWEASEIRGLEAKLAWAAQARTVRTVLQGHTDAVTSASFRPDGARIVTASKDKTARVWDAQSGQALVTLQGHTDAVMSASFSPDGARIVTASRDNTARVWDAKSGQTLVTLEGLGPIFADGAPNRSASSASFSPDGGRIVTASSDYDMVSLWDVNSGKRLFMLFIRVSSAPYSSDDLYSQVPGASFSPDGARIVIALNNKM
jgi:hypothetical protein